MTRRDEINREFEEWKVEALQADILAEAQIRHAKLKRVGSEWVGPCPVCGGKDRFGVNPRKKIFVCRGSAGGDVIAMIQHLDSCDFMTACTVLAGRPPPRGKGKELSPAEKAEIERKRAERARQDREREAEEHRRRAARSKSAHELWEDSRPIAGTLAEAYLLQRGLPVPPMGWPDSLAFHPAMEWEPGAVWEGGRRVKEGPRHPALVARIQDVGDETIGIHLIFLESNGKKARLDPNKVTRGSFVGGAVRLGGIGEAVDPCEGIETGLAIRALIEYRRPVFACLSTAGLAGLEPPLQVKRLRTWPDGDWPNRVDDELADDPTPPGRRAAEALQARMVPIGIENPVQPEPPPGQDYLDVYLSVKDLM